EGISKQHRWRQHPMPGRRVAISGFEWRRSGYQRLPAGQTRGVEILERLRGRIECGEETGEGAPRIGLRDDSHLTLPRIVRALLGGGDRAHQRPCHPQVTDRIEMVVGFLK